MQYAKYGAKRYFDPRMQHVTKSQHSYVLISFFLTAVKNRMWMCHHIHLVHHLIGVLFLQGLLFPLSGEL